MMDYVILQMVIALIIVGMKASTAVTGCIEEESVEYLNAVKWAMMYLGFTIPLGFILDAFLSI